MYNVQKKLGNIKLPSNQTWADFCFKVPIVQIDISALIGRKRRKRQDFSDFDDGFIDTEFQESDPSVDYYPSPYCNFVESMSKHIFLCAAVQPINWIFPLLGFKRACFELSLLELWAVNGEYNAKSDEAIENLTKEEILFKINHANFRYHLSDQKFSLENKLFFLFCQWPVLN